ncbi:zinc finger CCCH domain-containing protein [Trifolium repens]|nr:zinc finger CCCH domain-containing protein [Trifolium repens]
MSRDICRNFQRGSCKYGDRCRFIHQQQQQQRSNNGGFGVQHNTNPFGFGSASASAPNNHQKTNPFGFGTQNTSHSNAPPRSDYKPNQFQPFENKWSRSSSKPQNGTPRQSDNNSQGVNHKCTDPEVCKRQIVEDFQQEKPLWILTCYGHCKGAPCDILGDISYEELRAAAYEDARNGMSLPSIVEKERNILKSKSAEFDKLLSEPYKMPLNSSLDIQNYQSNGANANTFSPATQNYQSNGANANAFSRATQNYQSNGANANAFSPDTQNNGPLSVSSFSQLGASLNTGFERPSAPQMTTPAQPGSFGNGGNFFGSNTQHLFGSGISGAQSNPFSTPAEFTMFPGSTSQFQQASTVFNNTSSTTMLPTTSDVQLNTSQVENASVDESIWLKEKWIPGEIPEVPPPDRFIQDVK